MKFRMFNDMGELIQWLKDHTFVYYQAPLDSRPYSFQVRQYTINNRSIGMCRATVWSDETKTIVINLAQHLDRFRVREDMAL